MRVLENQVTYNHVNSINHGVNRAWLSKDPYAPSCTTWSATRPHLELPIAVFCSYKIYRYRNFDCSTDVVFA